MISVRNVDKTYRSGTLALEDVSLHIAPGQVFALLGPNGAGKTTLIKIICGLLRPTRGEVTIGGFDVVREYRKARRLVGLVPQDLPLDAFDTVSSAIEFSLGLFGRRLDGERVARVLHDFALWDSRNRRILELSGGAKRRVLIAKAVVHEPKILFLDEPTVGVDVSLRQDIWKLIRKFRDEGGTIVLTTHYLEEAQELSDQVGFINEGRLISVTSKDALMESAGGKELRVRLAQPLSPHQQSLVGQAVLMDGGSELRFGLPRGRSVTEVLTPISKLQELGLQVVDISTYERSLEDIFVDVIAKRGRTENV